MYVIFNFLLYQITMDIKSKYTSSSQSKVKSNFLSKSTPISKPGIVCILKVAYETCQLQAMSNCCIEPEEG